MSFFNAHSSCIRHIQYFSELARAHSETWMSVSAAKISKTPIPASKIVKIETKDYDEITPRPFVYITPPPSVPNQLISAANDGKLILRDMRDVWTMMPLNRVRCRFNAFLTSAGWSAMNIVRSLKLDSNAPPILTDDDSMLMNTTVACTAHNGCVWSIDVSTFMPFVLSGSADGTVSVGNFIKAETIKTPVQYLLYKLKWNHTKQEYTFEEDCEDELKAASRGKNANNTFSTIEISIQK
ncbi:hypothetical protein HK096_011439, partial [Nowakowskiella sp. JEL0078]